MITNAGGPGVLCVEAAARAGLDLVPLPNALAETLRAALPAEASVANPVDLLADAREDRWGMTLESVLGHAAAFDIVLMIHAVPFMVDAAPVVARLAELGAAAPVPVLHTMLGTLKDRPAWEAALEAAGVPMFADVEDMAACAGLLGRWTAYTLTTNFTASFEIRVGSGCRAGA